MAPKPAISDIVGDFSQSVTFRVVVFRFLCLLFVDFYNFGAILRVRSDMCLAEGATAMLTFTQTYM